MKNLAAFLALVIAIITYSCTTSKSSTNTYKYTIDDQALYDTIVKLDSTFFNYYNTCTDNLDKYAAYYSDSLEFYHDKGGLSTSKKDIVEGTKNNICGKVTRELVKGSLEVYPIPHYGAIEMGLHKFHNSQDATAIPHPSRFTIIWQQTDDGWKISEVISLH